MRIGVKYDGAAERVGALINRVPVPLGLSLYGMPTARGRCASTSSTTSTRVVPRGCSSGSPNRCGRGPRSASSTSSTAHRASALTPSSMLGLFFHLTSGADTYTADEVMEWMSASGYAASRKKTLLQLPGLALLRAERA